MENNNFVYLICGTYDDYCEKGLIPFAITTDFKKALQFKDKYAKENEIDLENTSFGIVIKKFVLNKYNGELENQEKYYGYCE